MASLFIRTEPQLIYPTLPLLFHLLNQSPSYVPRYNRQVHAFGVDVVLQLLSACLRELGSILKLKTDRNSVSSTIPETQGQDWTVYVLGLCRKCTSILFCLSIIVLSKQLPQPTNCFLFIYQKFSLSLVIISRALMGC